MKLWKGATLAFVLCAAALSTVLVRNMATIRQFKLKTKDPSSRSSSSSESTSRTSSEEPGELSQRTGGLHRKIRSTGNNMNSVLADFSAMFQSFTESELQQVLGTLIERKKRRDQNFGDNKSKRTKRAHKSKPCSLRRLELTVTELDLGHKSDETVILQYCSGKCDAHRQNYDLAMGKIFGKNSKEKSRRKKVSSMPCCRPTALEGISFFVEHNGFHTLRNISAKKCGCV
ncbi:neurturin [Kryptolebias marmoratus]|uniref:TGF-beta family profile domain-containing protein n=1 Tax=Kryptolebias marmoratus TaxID=37003 RepID=A0A3Q3H0A6_KRYMA|nr:neurturin [Kryptolebias marmoratus]XP_037837677.1 neurturin [Kryptolebias marmoratus]XP_037837678.1 neurturin [Kryptolebias marmoratus]XP_037837679.1 neurturin [Kryptolebias marmoratus]